MDRLLDRIAQLGRKKPLGDLDADHLLESPLKRNLTTFNILSLCLGETLGFGIFLVNGYVSKELAGPGAVISFIFAAIIAIVPAACFIEFGSKLPLPGSAYDYIYSTIGEAIAFIVGWNLTLEFIVRAISMSQLCSSTIDQLSGERIENFTIETFQGGNAWDYRYIVAYPDVIGSLCVLAAIAIVNFGAKFTARLVATLLICKYVVVCSSIYLDIATIGEFPVGFRDGFLPHGVVGVIRGVLPCFFAFTAFNAIGTTGWEAKKPQKSIPLSVICFMLLSLFTYTMNALSLNVTAAGSDIKFGGAYFETFRGTHHGWGKYLIGVGAVCTCFSSIVVNVFFVSRLLLAICGDGLLFSVLDQDTLQKLPAVKESISFGIVVGTTAMFIKCDAFEQFQSAGIICSLILVSVGVVILRYTPRDVSRLPGDDTDDEDESFVDTFGKIGARETRRGRTNIGQRSREGSARTSQLSSGIEERALEDDDREAITTSWLESSELALMSEEAGTDESPLESELARLLPSSGDEDGEHRQMRPLTSDTGGRGETTTRPPISGTLSPLAHPVFHPLARFPPGSVVATCLMATIAFQIGHAAVVTGTSFSFVSKGKVWALVQVLLLALSLASVIPIYLHHQRSRQKGVYEVPAVPTLPLISIFISILCVFQLPAVTWIRSLIWSVIGLIIYVTYGYSHSKWNRKWRHEARDVIFEIDCRPAMPPRHTYETVPTYQQLERNAESGTPMHRL